MDVRANTNIGFLAVALLSTVLVINAIPQSRRAGGLFISTQPGNCSRTKLRLELDGTPKPSVVGLRITRDSDKAEVVNQELNRSEDGHYYWTGLLVPLGKYKAELFDVRSKSMALGRPWAFNNIDILNSFIRERGEIIYISRGGDEAQTGQNNKEQRTLTVNQLPAPTGQNQIHIVVMDERGRKADEYYGSPPRDQRWTSNPLRMGRHHFIVAEYKKDQSCHVVRGR